MGMDGVMEKLIGLARIELSLTMKNQGTTAELYILCITPVLLAGRDSQSSDFEIRIWRQILRLSRISFLRVLTFSGTDS
jgi:hypothetical protein